MINLRARLQSDLLLLNGVTVLLILIISFLPDNALRIVLGLPFMLFLPGYVAMVAFFPGRDALRVSGRLGMSFGLSIVVVALIGLVLNYTAWGIRLYPVLISLAVFVFVTSTVAWYRRWRLTESERFALSFHLNPAPWKAQSFTDKTLSVVLMVAILGAVGTLIYGIATPRVGEKFTEFYILGVEGKAIDYPEELKAGEAGSVTVGIINQEQEMVNYRVEVMIDGVRQEEISPAALSHEDRWEQEVSFIPAQSGANQKVEFWLYKQGQSEAYRTIHLWVDVGE